MTHGAVISAAVAKQSMKNIKVLLVSSLLSSVGAQEWVFDPPECFGVGRPNFVTFLTGVITDNITVVGNWQAAYPLEDFGSLRLESGVTSGSPAALTYHYSYNSTGRYNPTLIAKTNGIEYVANLGEWHVSNSSCNVTNAPYVFRRNGVEWVVGYSVCSGVGVLNRIALDVSDASKSISVNGTWDDGNATVTEVYPPRNERYTLYYEHTYNESKTYNPYFVAIVDGEEIVANLYAPWKMFGRGCSRTDWEIPSSSPTSFYALPLWITMLVVLMIM